LEAKVHRQAGTGSELPSEDERPVMLTQKTEFTDMDQLPGDKAGTMASCAAVETDSLGMA
jgi:hypothetical protein